MRSARKLRRIGGQTLLLVSLTNAIGCTHNYYYGTGASPCAPGSTTVVPGAVQYGSVCEVPAEPGSSVVVRPSTPVVTSAPPPRVVVSEPNGSSRFAWKRADPDAGMVTTRVDGNIDTPSVVR